MKLKKIAALVVSTAVVMSLGACATNSDKNATDIPKQVEVVVPWAAGGGSDNATRQLLINAEKTCNTNFVVSNKTGAAGATGHEAGANAKPDGKTLTDMTAEVSILPHLGGTKVSYQSFSPIMRFASISPAFVVPADSEFKSIDDLIAAMKKGDQVRIGTTGRGGIWDIAAGGFAKKVGADFTERIPYDGGASIIAALLGKHIEVASLAAPEALAQVQAGKLRVLAIADEQRASVFPDVPTLKESGVDWATQTWFGIAAPAKTSEDLVGKLGKCLKEAWDTADYQDFLKKQGYNAAYLNTEDFKKFVEKQFKEFEALIPELY